jgi:hypothetical protein
VSLVDKSESNARACVSRAISESIEDKILAKVMLKSIPIAPRRGMSVSSARSRTSIHRATTITKEN